MSPQAGVRGIRWLSRHRWRVWTWGMMVVAFGVVTWPNVYHYLAMESMMFDIGNMSQAIWSVGAGQPLVYTHPTTGPHSRLGGHAEVLYILFYPLLRCWPSPVALIVAQGLLYLSGGWAAFRIAKRLLGGEAWGALGAFLYLWYPVAQTAALFDFHGDTLAMPLLLWALEAAEARAWRRYAFWIALALLSKVYVALPVALLGGIWWWQGQRKVGWATMLAALAWGGVVIFGLWAWFGTSGGWQGYLGLRYAQGVPANPEGRLWLWVVRLLTATVVFLPLLWVARWAFPWALPGVAVALLSLSTSSRGNAGYYGHHYALAVPFLVWGLLRALHALQGRDPRGPLRTWAVALSVGGLNLAAVLSVLVWPSFAALGGDLQAWRRGRWVLRQVQQTVPPDAPLLASPAWAPHLSLRPEVYPTLGTQFSIGEPLNLDPVLPRVRFALVDGFFEYGPRAYLTLERDTLRRLEEDPRFRYRTQWDGVILFQRASAERPAEPHCQVSPWRVPEPLNEALTLEGMTLQKVTSASGTLTLKGCFRWRRTALPPQGIYAVSALEGVPFSRGLHLTTWASAPPETWPEPVFVEALIWQVPYREGCYPLVVGWYWAAAPQRAADPRAVWGRPLTLGEICMAAGQAFWKPANPP